MYTYFCGGYTYDIQFINLITYELRIKLYKVIHLTFRNTALFPLTFHELILFNFSHISSAYMCIFLMIGYFLSK